MQKIYLSLALVMLFSSVAYAARCADYLTCEEAVIAWCKGQHPKADGDNDGIPCENVCKSLEQVKAIKEKINC